MNKAVQINFVQHHIITLVINTQVDHTTLVAFYLGDPKRLAFGVVDTITHRVDHPPQRCIVNCVHPLLCNGRKSDFNTTTCYCGDNAQTQLGFCVAYPALSGPEFSR